jgi:serine/threonine-protein kinase
MSSVLTSEFLDLQEQVAGRYSLDREIGRGGMGVVFLARDVTLDRPVAIKLLLPHFARQPHLTERFLNEARTAAKLSHPHIVPIHAVEEHGDLVFFVMTYVEGQTLAQRIANGGPLLVREGVRVLREIAWALVYAHGQGVVHRDIKADNILLEQGSGRALVTDFGIAVVDSTNEDGEIVGTPEFMSPEQIRGEPVDARSDLYSLGVLGFLVLAGRYPFHASSPAEMMGHHLSTDPPKLATLAPGIPARLGDIVDRCLVKDRDQRVDAAQDLADRFGAALEVRRDVPVPVRLFVEQLKRSERPLGLVYALVLLWVGVPLTIAAVFNLPGFAQIPALLALVAGAVSLPLLGSGRRIRGVLRSGYGRDDVVQALRQDLESRQEELVFLYGERYREHATRLRRIAYGSFAGSFALIGAVIAGAYPSEAGLMMMYLSSGALALTGAVTGLRADRRSDKKARRRWLRWKGRIGDWLFRLSGIGLKRTALPSTALTGRPTELAVGAAVLSLYEALPPATRRSMPDLRDVVRGLEDDAQRMRRLVDECTDALQFTAVHGSVPAENRVEGRQRIDGLRDQAQRRMQDAVAALETLRLDLLRLSAGTIEVASVTSRLGTAREVAADIRRLLDAQDEVQQLLAE